MSARAAFTLSVHCRWSLTDCSSNPVYVNDVLTNCCRIMCKIFTAAFCVSCMLSHGAIEHDLQLRESLLRIKQKNMAGEGRNRRVLGDICNVVTVRGAEGKQQLPQESRRAQLLANAQAAPADKSRRNVLVLRMWMELLLQMEVPRKPPQKRANVKPIKPEAVIVISPDTKEEAACGLKIKLPKEKIEDIDAGDVYNELAVLESLADKLKFLSFLNGCFPWNFQEALIDFYSRSGQRKPD
nr:G2/mitotic-specific cyclin S13-7-like isoform X1 [Ipomoea batatas]